MNQELIIPVKGARKAFGADPFEFDMPAGLTLAEIVDLVPGIPLSAAPRLRVAVNGVPVPAEWWPRVRPRPDGATPAIVTVYLVMGGGGGGNQTKSILALVATIALTVATGGLAAAGGPLALAIGATAAKAVAVGVGIVGSLLINALFKPPVSAATQGDQPLGQVSLSANLVARGAPLARVIGTHKVYPPLVSPALVEVIGDDEVVEAVFGLDGPHSITDIRVNDAPIADISDVQIEMRQGYLDDEALTLVTRQGFDNATQLLMSEHVMDPENGQRLLNQNDPASNLPRWERFISRDSPDEIWLTLLFGEGLWDSDNTGDTYRVPFRIRFRQLGSSVWVNGPEMHFARRRDQAFRTIIKIKWATAPSPLPTPPTNSGWLYTFRSVPAPVPGDTGVTSYLSDAGWTAHTSFASGAGISAMANVAQYTDRIELFLDEANFPKDIYEIELMRGESCRLSDLTEATYVWSGHTDIPTFFGYNLNGGNFQTMLDHSTTHSKVIVLRVASVWNEYPINSTKKALIAFKGKNKAFNSLSCVAAGLVPTWNGTEWDGLNVSSDPAANLRHVLAGEHTVYPLPDQQLDNIDFVGFSQFCAANGLRVNFISEGKAADEVARIIAATGVAFLRPSDRYGVVWEYDRTDESPVQVFTPRNSRDFSWTNALSVRPAGLTVTFLDEANNYNQTEVVVYDDGFDADTDPAPELDKVTYEGITTIEQAAYRATFDLRQARLRNVIYSLSAALESLICSRGSLVGVQYDVISRVAGFGRVTDIIFGSPSNLVVGLILDSEVPALDEPLLNAVPDLTEVEDVSLLGLTGGASISLKTGSVLTKALIVSGSDRRYIYFAEPFTLPTGLEEDCLVTVGILGQEYARMLVMDIKPRRDLTATLTLVDEAVDIHPLTPLESDAVAAMANLALALSEWSKLNDTGTFSLTVTINYLTLDRTTASMSMGTAVWNNVDERRDVEVLAKVAVIATTAGIDGLYACVVIRAHGNSRYQFGLGIVNGAKVLMWQSVFNGIVTTIATSDYAWSDNVEYWLRASVFADALMGKSWADLPGNPLFTPNGVGLAYTTGAAVNSNSWSTTIQYGAAPAGGATRHLILAISLLDDDGAGSWSIGSITVGGNPATIISQEFESHSNTRHSICLAAISMPAGTSGTLVVNVVNSSGAIDRYDVAVYRAINLRSIVPASVATMIGGGYAPSGVAITVPSNGFGILMGCPYDNSDILGTFVNYPGGGAATDLNTAYHTWSGGAALRTLAGTGNYKADHGIHYMGATFEFSSAPPDNETNGIELDVNDSTVFASGQVGLGVGGPGTEDVRCKFFSVGYTMGEAPSSP